MKKGKIFIGTSGWVYPHWEGIFYPEELSSKNYNPPTTRLKYYSKYFKTAEINYSFYHLPKPATYQNWHSQTPADFLFAVKASRFITHIKRLKNVQQAWKIFFKNALTLKEKFGPILFQFPPSFQATPENIKRLEEFLEFIISRHKLTKNTMVLLVSFAVEFRHQSWCDEKIYNLLKKYNIAWVIADSPSYPRVDRITADFVYIRLHGSQDLFSSKYNRQELKNLAHKIKKWQKQNKDVFVYFNNDAYGYAVENAKTLMELLK